MRVLLVTQELPPETGWGGIGTYAATLAPALVDAGADVHILSVVRAQDRSDQERGGVVIHRRHLRRPPGVGRATRLPETWDRLSLAVAVDQEVRRLEFTPDVIEAPEWRAEGLALNLRRQVPTVTRLHSGAQQLFPWVERGGLDARLAIDLERHAVRTADMVISTRSNLESLRASPIRGMPRVRVITPPVAPYAPAPPPSGVPRVTFVGRLERIKGPEILVSAAPRVLADVPDARFTFVGSDTGSGERSYLRHLRGLVAQAGVENAVEFLGHCSPARVAEEIGRSWICGFPSRQETFGYTAAEAAAMGRPIVAARIPAFVELFGDSSAGRLVPADDVPGWGSAISDLLRSPDVARRLAREGRQRVIHACAPSRVAGQTLDAYEEVIRRRTSSPRPTGWRFRGTPTARA